MATIICTIDSDTIDLVDGDESLIAAFKAELTGMAATLGHDVEFVDTHGTRHSSGLSQVRMVDADGLGIDGGSDLDVAAMAWDRVLNPR